MMEIHRRLALVMFGVAVDELLIVHAIHVGEFEIGNEPAQPCLRETVFLHGHFTNCTFLVYADPLLVVIAEQRFGVGVAFGHTVFSFLVDMRLRRCRIYHQLTI